MKAEPVSDKQPWKTIEDLKIVVAEYIDWFEYRRLHGGIGRVSPGEYEDTDDRHNPVPTTVGASLQGLRSTGTGHWWKRQPAWLCPH